MLCTGKQVVPALCCACVQTRINKKLRNMDCCICKQYQLGLICVFAAVGGPQGSISCVGYTGI